MSYELPNSNGPAFSNEWELPAWVGAVLLFGVADLVTTLVGIGMFGAVEANPVVAPVVETVGLWTLVPLKTLVLLGFWFAFLNVPEDYRAGVPIGRVLLGSAVAAWNAVVVVAVGGFL